MYIKLLYHLDLVQLPQVHNGKLYSFAPACVTFFAAYIFLCMFAQVLACVNAELLH